MAHIIYRPHSDAAGAMELFINGVDFTYEAFRDVELVSVGDEPFAEVGLRVTFAVSRLDLGGDVDVQITDRFPETAQLVHSMRVEADEA